ncbi:RagB/SusD family nutrient uptake outer membrane protein [Pseudoflavitalea rhizosphaerae]|uniref:RagB/SusD family nutrient uptake outer membrane protein n=1 Tax=Pseudoflavitalea rhizosphaerae TaxID=1884793 RepID=UPI0013DF5213|nr:RagB/SusD family nutrient uptake outer membrane protein [Pseudoflavitalea rhizosphaerae]
MNFSNLLNTKAGSAVFLLTALAFTGCKKLVEIDPPRETIATEKVFNTNQNAYSALAGMYSMMMTGTDGSPNFSNGGLSIYAGMMADELEALAGLNNPDDFQFYSNQLRNDNALAQPLFWDVPYRVIYSANSIIEGVAASTSPLLSDTTRTQLAAESKFVRAYCHFMLLNLHGDVPLMTTTDIRKTALIPRTPVAELYKQIEADLRDAIANLPGDYDFSAQQRSRPNKWAAAALLARVYLYQQKWAEAEAQATTVIDKTSLYDIIPLANVFKPNSTEAIFQLEHVPGNTHDITVEGSRLAPFFRYSELPPEYQALFLDPAFFPAVAPQIIPSYFLSLEQLAAFESDDNRRTVWVDGFVSPDIDGYHGKKYFYPVKYEGIPTANNAPIPAQAHMVLRLAEQYLIRAEARAQQGVDLTGAAADIDKIRNRAGLDNTAAASKEELLEAVLHERQTELFTEDGQRWFDLRRFGKANAILGALPNKQPWNPDHLLLPIPAREIQKNPLLVPNPGY